MPSLKNTELQVVFTCQPHNWVVADNTISNDMISALKSIYENKATYFSSLDAIISVLAQHRSERNRFFIYVGALDSGKGQDAILISQVTPRMLKSTYPDFDDFPCSNLKDDPNYIFLLEDVLADASTHMDVDCSDSYDSLLHSIKEVREFLRVK